MINDYSLSSLDTFKNETHQELKKAKYKDLEDMVYRLQLTNDEIVNILGVEYIAGSTQGYTLPPGVYKITAISLTLESLLDKEVKANITVDDIRLKSNLRNNNTKRFIKKLKDCFFTQN